MGHKGKNNRLRRRGEVWAAAEINKAGSSRRSAAGGAGGVAQDQRIRWPGPRHEVGLREMTAQGCPALHCTAPPAAPSQKKALQGGGARVSMASTGAGGRTLPFSLIIFRVKSPASSQRVSKLLGDPGLSFPLTAGLTKRPRPGVDVLAGILLHNRLPHGAVDDVNPPHWPRAAQTARCRPDDY